MRRMDKVNALDDSFQAEIEEMQQLSVSLQVSLPLSDHMCTHWWWQTYGVHLMELLLRGLPEVESCVRQLSVFLLVRANLLPSC